MRVIQQYQNAVILRVKAHYEAIYRYRVRLNYYLRGFDETFSKMFYDICKSKYVGLSAMTVKQIREYGDFNE